MVCLLVLFGSTACSWSGFEWQWDPTYRAISGIIVAGLVAGQWALTLGRVVFKRTGLTWVRWIQFHQILGLLLPFSIWAHSPSLGYGLLALLPIALLLSASIGSQLDRAAKKDRYLKWHVGLAGLSAAMALVHIYMVIAYN